MIFSWAEFLNVVVRNNLIYTLKIIKYNGNFQLSRVISSDNIRFDPFK